MASNGKKIGSRQIEMVLNAIDGGVIKGQSLIFYGGLRKTTLNVGKDSHFPP
jgi:hypothetical protein